MGARAQASALSGELNGVNVKALVEEPKSELLQGGCLVEGRGRRRRRGRWELAPVETLHKVEESKLLHIVQGT